MATEDQGFGELTTETLAYVSALIDIQGKITLMETQQNTSLPLLTVSCPNLPLLEFLGSLTQMKPVVTRRSYDKHRCSLHCEEAHEHVTSVSGRWSVSGAKATVVLAAILPYAKFQKIEIEEVLKVGLAAPRKKATPLKMQELGWPIPKEWVN